MFNSHMDSLGNNSLSDLLVDNNTNSTRIDVEDSAGSAVIVFVRHTFMDGTIDDNIDDITFFEGSESFADVDCTMLFESFSEFMSSSSSLSVAVGHGK